MTTRLRWCVGKFVYPRGSTQLLHYMRLGGFIVEDALDYTHLFLLRGLRDRSRAVAMDERLERWMATTSVKPVAEAAVELLAAAGGASRMRTVAEVYPGVGCTFEYLKYLGRNHSAGPLTVSHCGIGPAAGRRKYEVLHRQEPEPCSYLAETDGLDWLAGASCDLVIYHQNQSVRDAGEPAVGLDAFLEHTASCPRLLLAVRVAASDEQVRLTVKGHAVRVPAIRRVLDQCRRARGGWQTRYFPGFDSAFLIPDGQAETGLLVACAAPEQPSLRGCAPLPPA